MNAILKHLNQLSGSRVVQLERSHRRRIGFAAAIWATKFQVFGAASGRGTPAELSATHRFDRTAHQGLGFGQIGRSATCRLSRACRVRITCFGVEP